MPAPARPLRSDAARQVLAEAEPRPWKVAVQLRHARQRQMGDRPHPEAAEQRPVFPITALRADEYRRGDALRSGQEATGLAAEAVPDHHALARAEVGECGGAIEQRPGLHART